MWTKSEDLQNKYVKLSSQQDYETVTKVLHEFGFRMYDGIFNDGYYESYPFLKFYFNNIYCTFIDSSRVNTEIPIQQFYDYLNSKTLKVEDLIEGEVYRSNYGSDWLFKYNENNDETVYYLTPTSFSRSSWGFYKNKTITPCSSEDKLWLEACIKADKFIPKEEALKVEPKYEYEVVHCTTQEEWDFVLDIKKQNNKVCLVDKSTWLNYSNKSCFSLQDGCYSGLDFYKKHNSLILSFQEWCDKFNYKPDFNKPKQSESLVGRYLKALVNNPNGIGLANKGDYFIINDSISCTLIKDGTNHWLYNLRNGISEDFELIPKGFTPYNIIPEYVECIKAFLKQEVGDIEKTSEVPKWTYGWTKERFWKDFYKDYYKPSTKEAYEAQFKSTDTNWIPEVGEYVVMVNAGGWSYSPDNNGCVAKITEVNAKQFYNGVKTYVIAGTLINPKTSDCNSFNSIPLINSDKKLICRKALPHEIPNNNEVVLTPKTFDLSNTKIRVDTPELSKLVQEKAFKLGLYWGNKEKKVDYQTYKFLYFSKYKTITYGDDSKYFQNHLYKEIFPSDLGINIVNKEIRSIVNIGKNEYPVTSNEVFQQEGLIDTNVNKIQSVSVELYQPEELQLF